MVTRSGFIRNGGGLVCRCGLVSGSGLVGGCGLVGRGGLVGRCGLVSRGGLVGRCGFVSGSGFVFLCVSRVCHISLVSGVSISNCVSDSLGATIGEEDAVLTVGCVSISRLFLVEVHTMVVINDSVVVIVVGGFFMVCRGGFVGGGGAIDIIGGGNSQECNSNKSLKITQNQVEWF